jgi:hypothetical protein
LYDAARRADEIGKSGRLDAAGPLMTELEQRYGEVLQEIETLLNA